AVERHLEPYSRAFSGRTEWTDVFESRWGRSQQSLYAPPASCSTEHRSEWCRFERKGLPYLLPPTRPWHCLWKWRSRHLHIRWPAGGQRKLLHPACRPPILQQRQPVRNVNIRQNPLPVARRTEQCGVRYIDIAAVRLA